MSQNGITTLNSITVDVNGTPVTLVHGDITKQASAAYVVPHFSDRVSEGGVAFAFKKEWGHDVADLYRQYLSGFKEGLDYSTIVCGQDKEKDAWLLHAVTVRSGRDKAFETIGRAVANAMMFAAQRNLPSVAFPALGTGPEGELEDAQSALSMLNAIHEHGRLREGKNWPKVGVTIAVWDWESARRFATFRRVLTSDAYVDIKPQPGMRAYDPQRHMYEREKTGRSQIVVVGQGGPATPPDRPKGDVISLNRYRKLTQ